MVVSRKTKNMKKSSKTIKRNSKTIMKGGGDIYNNINSLNSKRGQMNLESSISKKKNINKSWINSMYKESQQVNVNMNNIRKEQARMYKNIAIFERDKQKLKADEEKIKKDKERLKADEEKLKKEEKKLTMINKKNISNRLMREMPTKNNSMSGMNSMSTKNKSMPIDSSNKSSWGNRRGYGNNTQLKGYNEVQLSYGKRRYNTNKTRPLSYGERRQ